MKNAGYGADIPNIVNTSIAETMTRTIFTSATTFVMVLCLFVFGTSSIREFALPIMIGIVCGGYSSVFITGPLWNFLNARTAAANAKKKVEEAAEGKKKKKA